MSLYDRLNLTKQTTRSLKIPIWERIDLTRPHHPKCPGCRLKIQAEWRICPQCGFTLAIAKNEYRHCIWIDVSELDADLLAEPFIKSVVKDSFSQVFSAFRSVRVFLTSEQPNIQQWGENYTHVSIIIDLDAVNYLGVASFLPGKVTNRAVVRLDRIIAISNQADLSLVELSNLTANTIVHEIGHTLGLDHSTLSTDVMHDGLDHQVHSLMPPSFHAEQITRMNYAIYQDGIELD